MSIAELIDSAQYVVDAQGKRQAVQVSLDVWEKLLTLIEEQKDEDDVSKQSKTQRLEDLLAREENRQGEVELQQSDRQARRERLLALLQNPPDDDKSPEWWDEFEEELRQNRFSLREIELD